MISAFDTSALLGRIEELEEENRQLREAIEPGDEHPFGLTRTEAAIFRSLQRGGMVNSEILLFVMDQINETVTAIKTLRVLIARIRQKTEGYCTISTVYGCGYRMEEAQ